MGGESNLSKLIANMDPFLNEGKYVFCTVKDDSIVDRNITICEVREKEGKTVVLSKKDADQLHLDYSLVMSWITLNIHSALETVGLTAAFASALGQDNISCNVVAGFYHDHIFVAYDDKDKAMHVLKRLSKM